MTAFPSAVRRFGMTALDREEAAARPQKAYRAGGGRPARRRVVVRLWVPTTAIFCMLAPVPLLLAPLAWLSPPAVRSRNPYAAVLAIGRTLIALGGTLVDIDTPDARVRVRLF